MYRTALSNPLGGYLGVNVAKQFHNLRTLWMSQAAEPVRRETSESERPSDDRSVPKYNMQPVSSIRSPKGLRNRQAEQTLRACVLRQCKLKPNYAPAPSMALASSSTRADELPRIIVSSAYSKSNNFGPLKASNARALNVL